MFQGCNCHECLAGAHKTAEKIDNIGRMAGDIHRMRDLYGPLILDSVVEDAFIAREDRVKLSKEKYLKQFDAGIDRVSGLDIVWI